MKSWYSITNKSDTLAEISIYEEIGFFGVTAKQFLADLKAVGDRRLKLRINSPGGEVFEGLAIYNRLREHKGGVDVHIDGLAASMASVIAMAGTTVQIAENALIMIHNPNGLVVGDAEDMRDTAALLDKVRDSLVTAYERKTGLSGKKIAAMMDEETWLNASEAKAMGFVDEVTAPLKLAARFDNRKFRNPPPQISNMKILTASIAALLATATGAKLTEDSTEADVKAALDTLTGQVTAADGQLAPLKTQVADLTKERDQLKAQFGELEKTASEQKTKLTEAEGKVTNLTAELGDTKTKLTASGESVTRLEKLCKVKGIDPKAAVPTVDDPDQGDALTEAHFEQRLRAAKSHAERAQITAEFEQAAKDGKLK